MKENSRMRMKMSIANELFTDQRQGDENRDAQGQPKPSFARRIIALCLRQGRSA